MTPGPHDGRRAQTIRIYLKHHNDPTGKFQPRSRTCEDYTDRKGTEQKGCGGTVWRYVTFPNEKGMLFDSEPVVEPNSEVSVGNGGIVASVYTDNVHFATCSARRPAERPTDGFRDGRAEAAGSDAK